jgi:hypothetical protein
LRNLAKARAVARLKPRSAAQKTAALKALSVARIAAGHKPRTAKQIAAARANLTHARHRGSAGHRRITHRRKPRKI